MVPQLENRLAREHGQDSVDQLLDAAALQTEVRDNLAELHHLDWAVLPGPCCATSRYLLKAEYGRHGPACIADTIVLVNGT